MATNDEWFGMWRHQSMFEHNGGIVTGWGEVASLPNRMVFICLEGRFWVPTSPLFANKLAHILLRTYFHLTYQLIPFQGLLYETGVALMARQNGLAVEIEYVIVQEPLNFQNDKSRRVSFQGPRCDTTCYHIWALGKILFWPHQHRFQWKISTTLCKSQLMARSNQSNFMEHGGSSEFCPHSPIASQSRVEI